MDPWNSANLKVLKIKLNYALFHPPTVMPWLVNKPNRKISLSLLKPGFTLQLQTEQNVEDDCSGRRSTLDHLALRERKKDQHALKLPPNRSDEIR